MWLFFPQRGWSGLRFPGLRSLPQKDKNAAIARYKKERPDLLAEYEAEMHVMSGSSNFTYAGLATNRELNLGQFNPHPVAAVRGWFEELWAESERVRNGGSG